MKTRPHSPALATKLVRRATFIVTFPGMPVGIMVYRVQRLKNRRGQELWPVQDVLEDSRRARSRARLCGHNRRMVARASDASKDRAVCRTDARPVVPSRGPRAFDDR